MRRIYSDFYIHSIRTVINKPYKRSQFSHNGMSGADSFYIYQTFMDRITDKRLISVSTTYNFCRIILEVNKELVYVS